MLKNSSCNIKAYVTSFSEEVTGSNTIVKLKWPDGRQKTLLIDCGLFQEFEWESYNNNLLPYAASNVDFAIITHGHTDHIGRIPYLTACQFEGAIYTSYETREIFTTMLQESLTQMKNDLKTSLYKWKKEKQEIQKANKKGKKNRGQCETKKFRKKSNMPLKPKILFTAEDIKKAYSQLKIMKTEEVFSPCEGLEITFFKNAHMLGAICAFCRVFDDDEELCFFVTGDLGIYNTLTEITTIIPKEIKSKVSFIISESTYGGQKQKRDLEQERERHAQIINETLKKQGTIVYMSNSLERPEIIAVDLKRMQNDPLTSEAMANVKIYLDTTLGITCYRKYVKMLGKDFLPKNWQIITKEDREEKLNMQEAKIFICTSPRFYQGSFVCYGKKIIQNPKATLLFVAYVPESIDTIIRLPKGSPIEYLGEHTIKNCNMERFNCYSSHASKDELKEFLKSFKNNKLLLFQHGSNEAKDNMVRELESKKQVTVAMQHGKTIVITNEGLCKIYN